MILAVGEAFVAGHEFFEVEGKLFLERIGSIIEGLVGVIGFS
jgi:hypothetical protein